MCKNMVDPDRPRMTMWRMSFTCWIPKNANTQPEYVILIAFPPLQLLYERAWMLRYTYIVYFVYTLELSDRWTDLMSIFLSFKGAQTYAFIIREAELNPLNAELNPIYHLLALWGTRHILHVSRIRVNSLRECLFYVYAPQFWFGIYLLENILIQKTYSQAAKFRKIQKDSGILRRVDW